MWKPGQLFARRRPIIKAAPKFRPALETLERRETPANVVTTAFAGGNLTIVGQNEFSGVFSNNNNSFYLTGGGQGVVTVTGNASSISGATNFTGVKNIILKTGLGDDYVTTINLNIAGNLKFEGGDGDDTLFMNFNAAEVTTLGSLTVTNGDGTDTVQSAGTLNVLGAAIINNGDGGSNIALGTYGNDTTKFGSLAITNGDGFDTFSSFWSSTFHVAGAFSMSNGTGGSNITIGGTSSSTSGVFVGGGTTITGTAGDDNVTFNAGTSGANTLKGVTVSLGNGSSTVDFNGPVTQIFGNLSVTTLDGPVHDVLASGVTFQVTGTTTVKNGHGQSQTRFEATGTNTLTGAVSITNLEGRDVFELGTLTANTTTGAITLNSGNGNNSVDIDGNVQVNGAVTATFGSDISDEHDFDTDGTKFKSTGGITINHSASTLEFGLGANENDIGGLVKIVGTAFTSQNLDFGVSAGDITKVKGVTVTGGHFGADIAFRGVFSSSAAIAITSGDGADIVSVADSFNALAGFSVITGAGADAVTISSTIPTINGALTINTGAGNDTVTLKGLLIGGATLIDTGSLNDIVRIDNSTFNGTVTVNAGGGNDQVLLEFSSNDATISRFNKTTLVNLGTGDDYSTVGLPSDANDYSIFVGAVTWDGGTGINELELFIANRFNQYPVGSPITKNFALVE